MTDVQVVSGAAGLSRCLLRIDVEITNRRHSIKPKIGKVRLAIGQIGFITVVCRLVIGHHIEAVGRL